MRSQKRLNVSSFKPHPSLLFSFLVSFFPFSNISLSWVFILSPLVAGQILERIATEFNQLQFHAVQSKGMPLLDKMRPVSSANSANVAHAVLFEAICFTVLEGVFSASGKDASEMNFPMTGKIIMIYCILTSATCQQLLFNNC